MKNTLAKNPNSMKLNHMNLALVITFGLLSCGQRKEETQTSIEEKAKRSSSKQPADRPKTGIPAAEAARQVGYKNDERAKKSNELLKKAKKQ